MMEFLGMNGFIWGIGVVEDRNDPEMLGRCRVRVFGIHTENKEEIPTDTLPWAHPVLPITSAGISGIGQSPTGPVEGTWVLIFFRDGENCQEPIMLGVIPGFAKHFTADKAAMDLNEQLLSPKRDMFNPLYDPQDSIRGFEDPRTNFGRPIGPAQRTQNTDGSGTTIVNPEKNFGYPKSGYFLEPNTNDLNRLSKSQNTEYTVVQEKRTNAEKTQANIPAAETYQFDTVTQKGSKFSEPPTKYAAQYPYNHVQESESGHIIEIDDTPGAERLHTFHRSGTFEEIHPDGTRVTKIVNDNYDIVLRDNFKHVEGKMFLTVDGGTKIFINADGDKKNASGTKHLDIHVGTGANINVLVEKGDVNLTLKEGHLNTYVNGNHNHFVTGDYRLTVGGNYTEGISGDHASIVVGERRETTVGDKFELTQGSRSCQIKQDNTVKISGDGSEFVGGTRYVHCDSDVNRTTNGSLNETVSKDATYIYGSQLTTTAVGNMTTTSTGGQIAREAAVGGIADKGLRIDFNPEDY